MLQQALHYHHLYVRLCCIYCICFVKLWYDCDKQLSFYATYHYWPIQLSICRHPRQRNLPWVAMRYYMKFLFKFYSALNWPVISNHNLTQGRWLWLGCLQINQPYIMPHDIRGHITDMPLLSVPCPCSFCAGWLGSCPWTSCWWCHCCCGCRPWQASRSAQLWILADTSCQNGISASSWRPPCGCAYPVSHNTGKLVLLLHIWHQYKRISQLISSSTQKEMKT